MDIFGVKNGQDSMERSVCLCQRRYGMQELLRVMGLLARTLEIGVCSLQLELQRK